MNPWFNSIVTPNSLALLFAKSLVIAGSAIVLTYALRNRSGAARYQVWTAAMVLTIITVAAALLPWHYEVEPPSFGLYGSVRERVSAQGVAVGDLAPTARNATKATPSSIHLPTSHFEGNFRWTLFLIDIWLLGVAAFVIRMIIARAQLARVSRRAELAQGRLRYAFDLLVREIGLSPTIELLLSEDVDVPLTCGVVRKRIVLPSSSTEWNQTRLDHVLRHELIHVKRLDIVSHLAAELACAFSWYNPLIWIAAKRMRADCEIACDDAVLACGANPVEYASDLVALAANTRFGDLHHASVAMAGGRSFDRRIRSILNKHPRPQLTKLVTAVLVAAAVGGLGFAAVQLQDRGKNTLPTNSSGAAFIQLMWSGNVEEARNELQRDPSLVNVRGPLGQSPLEIALESISPGGPELAKLLVSFGADVNGHNAVASPPLALAVRYPEVVKLLLDHGADVNLVGYHGRTALDDAASGAARHSEYRASGQMLLQHGASLSFSNAVALGEMEAVRDFLRKDPSLATATIHRWPRGFRPDQTPLEVAAKCEGFDRTTYPPIVELLASYVHNPTFFAAVMMGRLDLVSEDLTRDPAQINQTGDDHVTNALNWAVRTDDKRVVELLLNRGAKPDRSSLTDAIEVGDKSIVELLLANGADPHGRTGIGLNLTMYQFALAEHRKEIAELLK